MATSTRVNGIGRRGMSSALGTVGSLACRSSWTMSEKLYAKSVRERYIRVAQIVIMVNAGTWNMRLNGVFRFKETNTVGGTSATVAKKKPNDTLSPQELSQTKSTGPVAAQADQSNEHNEKQNDVGNEGDDNVKFVALGIGWHAAVYDMIPLGAKTRDTLDKECNINDPCPD